MIPFRLLPLLIVDEDIQTTVTPVAPTPHAFSPFAAPGRDRIHVTARVSCARVKVKAHAPGVETSDYSPEWIAFDEQEAAGALLLM